jgi:hypothetical protein
MRNLKSLLPLLAIVTVACGEPHPDQIDNLHKFKILAVRAESPDLHPGGVTQVKVLAGAPGSTSMTTFVMPFSQTVVADYGQGRAQFGSAGTAYTFAPGTTMAVPAIDLGVSLPAQPAPNFGTAYYHAPVTPGTYTLGVFAREGVPTIDLAGGAAGLQRQLAAEMESALKAFKTIRVRAANEPLNKNPKITALVPEKRWRKLVDGALKNPIAPEGFVVGKEQVVRVRVDFEDEKPDRPSTVWWKTDGDFYGYGRNDADWVAPDKAGIYTLIAVTLDREGGVDWFFQDLAVSPGVLEPDAVGPVTEPVTASFVLAQSGGRMLWLRFDEAAAGDEVANALSSGPVVLGGVVQSSAESRLKWSLAQPGLVGTAADVTTPVITANDIYGVPRAKTPVQMRFDALVAGPVQRSLQPAP